MATGSRTLLLWLASAFVICSIVQSAAAQGCPEGCALHLDPVCGSNGVTFQNGCLAACAGAVAAAAGACDSPNGNGGAAAAGGSRANGRAAGPGPLVDHPIARFFDAGAEAPAAGGKAGAAGGGGAARVATQADISRFASEGFVLAGAAALAPGGRTAAKPSSSPGADALAAARSTNAQVQIFELRVVPSTGLLYVGSTPITSGAADAMQSGGAPQQPQQGEGAPRPAAARGEQQAPRVLRVPGTRPLAAAAGGRPGASAIGAADGAAASKLRVVRPPRIRAKDWLRLTSLQAYPYTTVGFIGSTFSSFDFSCSGVLIGNYTVVTAGHCIWDRGMRRFASNLTFTPHHFFRGKGRRAVEEAPFGAASMAYLAVQSGWISGWPMDTAYASDMAVAVLEQPLGAAAGTMGFRFSPDGYTGALAAAGYPGESVVNGEFFKLTGRCNVSDTDGTDGLLTFKAAGKPRGCSSACSIAEAGQSGQPAWETDASGGAYLVGVLSHGPPPRTCKGADEYCQVSALTYDMLLRYKDAAPGGSPMGGTVLR
ncbi:MAG: hypothetical protein J3K34DRAFT_519056 [Monoraphidium minutum]|nr:MAG: hypothetical protein J3K34DRAFT_519056 [Monoraphidium minutum]